MKKMNLPEKVNLKCLFCGSSNFVVKKDDEGNIVEQETYECGDCGELNLYEGLIDVCNEETMEIVKQEMSKYVKNLFKDLK
jgi:transposase-like protein